MGSRTCLGPQQMAPSHQKEPVAPMLMRSSCNRGLAAQGRSHKIFAISRAEGMRKSQLSGAVRAWE